MNVQINVRNAEFRDIDQLVNLNKSWIRSALESNFQNGFLTSLYTEQEFEKIIKEKEIVVAEDGNKIIGWYLINNQIENEVRNKNHSIIKMLINEKKISKTSRVGLGAQALVIKDYQGQGIRESMLKLLTENLKDKYHFLFSSIQKMNTRANAAHLKDNWQIVAEDENRVYVIYHLKSVLIIGWSLINSAIHTPLWGEMQKKITDFKKSGLLNPDCKIAIGQKFIEPTYRGNGIVERMTEIQDNLVAHKYDIYMATVKCDNKPSEFFFKKNSFHLFHQDDLRLYFSKAITQHNTPEQSVITINGNNGIKKIRIRPGEAGDEIYLNELNKKWVKEALNGDFTKGFLTSLYSTDQFRMIIEKEEIVVAELM